MAYVSMNLVCFVAKEVCHIFIGEFKQVLMSKLVVVMVDDAINEGHHLHLVIVRNFQPYNSQNNLDSI